jgi:hypothetical protein
VTVAKKGYEPSIYRLGHQHSRPARPGDRRYGVLGEQQLQVLRKIVANTNDPVCLLDELGAKSGALVRYRAEMVPDSSIARIFGGPFVQHETKEQFALLAAEVIRCKAQ